MPKLIINISEDDYHKLTFYPVCGKLSVDVENLMLTFQNGVLLPDNATNGDLIKAMFPDIEIGDSSAMEHVYTGIPFGEYIGANVDAMRDWWNAPYTGGNNNEVHEH